MNLVILKGRIGKEPETRQTTSGKDVANFSLATSEYYNEEEHTEWHNIVAWGGTAKFVENYCGKGREVLIQGKIQTRKWEDKDGNSRRTTEVVAFKVEFCGPKPNGDNGPARDSDRDYASVTSLTPGVQDDADDLPF
jgi:single-strand DNA-binding protein